MSSPTPSNTVLALTFKPEPEHEPIPEPEQAPILEPKHEPLVYPESKPIRRSKRKSATSAIAVTTEELYEAYKVDQVAADANLNDKILEVTGVLDRIIINRVHGAYYIILSSVPKKEEWNVRCIFEKKDERELNKLTEGQTVTVQGKYDGYKLNIMLRDCVFV